MLEPLSQDQYDKAILGEQQDRAIQLSIAVSLKRIADQFDGSAKGISLYDYVRWNHDREATRG